MADSSTHVTSGSPPWLEAKTPFRANKSQFDDGDLSAVTFKMFVVVSLALAAITIVTGVLALMVSKGGLPTEISSFNNLRMIGEVNSYVMICGGIGLFIIGMLAWAYHGQSHTPPPGAKRQLHF